MGDLQRCIYGVKELDNCSTLSYNNNQNESTLHLVLAITPTPGNIVYVDQSVDTTAADYNGTGNSWADAIPELRDALTWAADNEIYWSAENTLQIRVAAGLYTPVEPNDPANVTISEYEATFQLLNHVQVYGGFDGTEEPSFELGTRGLEDLLSILSGDIDENDTTRSEEHTSQLQSRGQLVCRL